MSLAIPINKFIAPVDTFNELTWPKANSKPTFSNVYPLAACPAFIKHYALSMG
jgi:hypothetical protein